MVALTETVTDARGLTDTGQSLGHAGSITDSAVLTEVATSEFLPTQWVESVTDGLGLTDAGHAIGHAGSTSDELGATDSASGDLVANFVTVDVTDPVVVADALAFDRGPYVEDDRGAVEDSGGVVDVDESIADATGVTDAPASDVPLSVSDAVGLTDSAALVADKVTTVTDGRGAADSASVDASGAVDLVDTVAAGDAVTLTADVVLTLEDATGASDAATASVGYAATATDAAVVADTATTELTWPAQDHAVTVTDAGAITADTATPSTPTEDRQDRVSRIKEFKAALFTACESIYTTPTVVTYGHPLQAGSHAEIVSLLRVDAVIDPDSLGTTRPRREELSATVEVYVGSGGTDQQAVTERALDLADELEMWLLDTDPTVDGTVVYAFVTAVALTETGESDEDELAQGRFARVTATITARARY